ncbi:oligomeric, coiled-coil, peripheral membrane protein [Podila epigama]|nr:oligomeric, coiled-coil, peripheral membrane protein [Podila epigama]
MELDTLRLAIEKATRIPQGSQILMTDTGLQLKPDMMFEAITSTGKDEYTIMVYNREVLTTDISSSILTLTEQPKSEPTVQPLSPSILQPITLPSRPQSPTAHRDWATHFQRTFDSYVAHILAYYRVIVAHAGICERIMEELRMQSLAVQVALTNLDAHSQSVLETFEKFNLFATKELAKQARLLQSFPRDIEALRQIRVHPALLPGDSPDRHISDFIPTEKLVLWADRCREIHEGLLRDGKDLSRSIREVQEGTVAIRSNSGINLEQLEDAMVEILEVVEKQSQIRQRVERDQLRVKERLADISKPEPLASSGTTLESLGQLANVYTSDYMQFVKSADEMLRNKLSIFIAAKRSQTANLITQLMHISKLQSTIASIPPSLANLDDALRKRDADFSQLVYVQRIPIAYGALIVEIVRRREYSKLLLQKSQQLAEVMSRFRQLEQRRRDSFRSEVAKFVPVVVPGLDDAPPFSEINALSTRDRLPPFTREHVIEFEGLISQLSAAFGQQESSIDGHLLAGTESNPDVSSVSGQEPHQDALSKLRVALVKMTSQMDVMGGEFDRILEKAFYSERIQRLEDENARLRADMSRLDTHQRSGTPQLAQHSFPRIGTPVGAIGSVPAGSASAATTSAGAMSTNAPGSTKLTRQPSRSGNSANINRVEADEHQQMLQQQIQQNQRLSKENTDLSAKIKAYEIRIRSLEETLYQNFRASTNDESSFSDKDFRQQASSAVGQDHPWKTAESTQPTGTIDQAKDDERKRAAERVATLEQDIAELSLKLEQTEENLRKEVMAGQQAALANDEVHKYERDADFVMIDDDDADDDAELKLQSATIEEATELKKCDHASIQKRSDELEDELRGMSQKYDHLLQRHEKETEIQALEVVAFKERIEELNKQIGLEKEIFEGQLEQAKRISDEATERVVELENELIVVNEELQNKVLELEEQLEAHAAEHEEVTARAEEQEKQLASHRAVYEDILAQLKEQEQKLTRSQDAEAKTIAQHSLLKEAHDKLEQEHQSLRLIMEETKRTKDELMLEVSALQKQVADLEVQRETYKVDVNLRLEEAKTMVRRAEEDWKEKSRLLEQSERATKDLSGPIKDCMASLGHHSVTIEVVNLAQVREKLQKIHQNIEQVIKKHKEDMEQTQRAHEEAVVALKMDHETSRNILETTIASLHKVRRDAEAAVSLVKEDSEATILQLKTELENMKIQQRASSIPVPVSTSPDSGQPLTLTSPTSPSHPTMLTGNNMASAENEEQFSVKDRILIGTLALDLGIPLPLLSDEADQDVVSPTSSVLLDNAERRKLSGSTILTTASGQGGGGSSSAIAVATGGTVRSSGSTTVPLSTELLQTIELSNLDVAKATALIKKKLFDTEHLLKRWQRECKSLKEKYNRAAAAAHEKIAFRNFKVDDLTLFLPTRNSLSKPWAAFNINFPHYFLKMTPSMANQLRNREWIVARITSITEAVVDKRQGSGVETGTTVPGAEEEAGAVSSGINPHNPFGLADGVKYYLLEATSWSGHSHSHGHGHGHGKSSSSHHSSTSGSGSSSGKLRHHASTPALGEMSSSSSLTHSSSRRDMDMSREHGEHRSREPLLSDRRKYRDSLHGDLDEEHVVGSTTTLSVSTTDIPSSSTTNVNMTEQTAGTTHTTAMSQARLPPTAPSSSTILSQSTVASAAAGAVGATGTAAVLGAPATGSLGASSHRHSTSLSGTLPISIPYQSPATNALRAISSSVGSTGSGGSSSITSLLTHHLVGATASGSGTAIAASSPPRTMLLSSSPHKTGISPVVATGTTVGVNHSSATGHSASHAMNHSQSGLGGGASIGSSGGASSPNIGSSAMFGSGSMPIHPSRLSTTSNRDDLEQLAVFATDEDQEEMERKENEKRKDRVVSEEVQDEDEERKRREFQKRIAVARTASSNSTWHGYPA